MLEPEIGKIKEHPFEFLFFILASIIDATSTVLAKTKPGTKELNPISAPFVSSEPSIGTVVILSALPLLVLVVFTPLWARSSKGKVYRLGIRGVGVTQVTAGIHNTLIYIDSANPIAFIAIFCTATHYITRMWIENRKDEPVKLMKELRT